MKRRYYLLVFVLLLLPFSVTSTPPSISFDVFEVKGTLFSASNSLEDHTVMLVHRDHCRGAYQWCLLANCDIEDTAPYGPYTAITLTRHDGRFALRVAVCNSWLGDTLAVAVIYPDTMLIGSFFTPEDLEYTPITKTGHRTDDGFFCDRESEFEYERARIYRVPAATVNVP